MIGTTACACLVVFRLARHVSRLLVSCDAANATSWRTMSETKIGWTSGPNGEPGFTINPWSGCFRIHTGCAACYAEALPPSMRRGAQWGEVWQGGTRVIASESYMRDPFKWARQAAKEGQRFKVFCASTADVLEVPENPASWPRGWADEQIARASEHVRTTRDAMNAARERLWDTIRKTAALFMDDGEFLSPLDSVSKAEHVRSGYSGLDWLLLTKRPENWALVPEDIRPLVWLGTSISDQKTADEYVPRLLSASGHGFRYLFLSAEPLVGPIDLRPWLLPRSQLYATATWVICGGESGRKARPCNVEWIRSIVTQCREARVPCFVKQDFGEKAGLQGRIPDETWRVKEWPDAKEP